MRERQTRRIYNNKLIQQCECRRLDLSPRSARSAGRGPKARRPEGEGANLDRHLVPYHVKQGESNLASSLYIYLFICINRGPHARHRNFGPGK